VRVSAGATDRNWEVEVILSIMHANLESEKTASMSDRPAAGNLMEANFQYRNTLQSTVFGPTEGIQFTSAG